MTAKMKNLIIRTLTGIVFVGLLVGSILNGPLTFCLLFALLTLLSVREYCSLVNRRNDIQVNTFICTVAGLYLFLAFAGYCSHVVPSGVFIPYLISIVYLFISELYLKRPNALNNWAYSMLSQMYVALPFSLLPVLAFQTNPNIYESSAVTYVGLLPLSVFIFLWSNDTGAYCFGSLFGRRKLFPSISPNKSWEGALGGGITALAVAVLLARFNDILTLWQWLGLALVVVIFGTWGDLVESLMKRQLGLKDSGSILPGHGGMLDRLDSSLLAVPAAAIYLYTLTLW